MSDARRSVILFGLSANPPTGDSGHAGIVRHAASLADEVWVLPVYRHAFPEKDEMAPYADRRALAQLAFEHLPGLEGRVHVLDVEREVAEALSGRIGTIDVVHRLMRDHPEVAFSLLLGADTYRDLLGGRWKEGDLLRTLVPVLVVARPGVALDADAGGAIVVPGLSDVSSSQVRGSTDLAFLTRVLQPEVLAYIRAHRLYAIGAVS